MEVRKIIHIDMDAFFASVEQRDNPALRGKPVAVGHDGPRGVVATASYEARPYGVHSALSIVQAKRLCPSLLIVPPRFDVYKSVSSEIHEIFHEYTDLVEPLSLDEAFLDVTHHPVATAVAEEIRHKIFEKTGLTSSAGVSINKMLAKIASDYRKPNGLFVIKPRQVLEFVAQLPVEKFFGVGKVTADKMHKLGLRTGLDLRNASESMLVTAFGKAGHDYHNYGYGIDNRPVVSERERKSVGCENTFLEDTDRIDELRRELEKVGEEAWRRAGKGAFRGKTVVLKIKFDDFRQATRSASFADAVPDLETFLRTGMELLDNLDLVGHKIRLIGLTLTGRVYPARWIQLKLPFDDADF